MKKAELFFATLLLIGVFTLPAGGGNCPEGQYRDLRSGKCAFPGDDPGGVTDWEYRRQLIEEGQGYCKKDWCCDSKAAHERCVRSGDKEGQGACQSCFKY